MIEHSNDITTLATALLGAQAVMGGAKRDAKNPHFKSSYATLETVIEAAKPALQASGIAFLQAPGQLVDGALEVTTMLVHGESGQWMRSTLHVPLQKRDPQGVGSAITYACRYSLMAMLGIPPTDDDGESAMDRSERPLNLPAAKSSAALKRDGFWPEFERELAECGTLVTLERFKSDWRKKALDDGWNAAWKAAAKDKIEGRDKEIRDALDAMPDEVFPGDMPSRNSNLHMAG